MHSCKFCSNNTLISYYVNKNYVFFSSSFIIIKHFYYVHNIVPLTYFSLSLSLPKKATHTHFIHYKSIEIHSFLYIKIEKKKHFFLE